MMFWLTIATIASCWLVCGIFFAFSSFVMPSINDLVDEQAVKVMQSINRFVYHWSFMSVFFGAPILSLILAIVSAYIWRDYRSLYNLLGCLVYMVGCFAVTGLGNVPLNTRLESLITESHGCDFWPEYYRQWLKWNHVRTTASALQGFYWL